MANGAVSSWTDAKVSELRKLWATSATARQIGAALGVSRNAVISKAHRIGLSERRKATHPAPSAEKLNIARKEARAPSRRQPKDKRGFSVGERTAPMEIVELPVQHEALSIPFGDLRTWSGLTRNQCRFIAAEPAGPEYLACGTLTAVGESWCEDCKRIVFNYQPANVIPLRPKQARAA